MVADVSIALLSNVTVDLLVRQLNKTLKGEVTFENRNFNQYRQELLGTDSWLIDAKPSAVILLLDPEEFLQQAAGCDKASLESMGNAVAADIIGLIENAKQKLPATSFMIGSFFLPRGYNLPALEYNSDTSLHHFVETVNLALERFAAAHSGVFIIDMGSFITTYGWNNLADARLWVMGRIRYSAEGHEWLAQWLASYVRPLLSAPRKVLALDLDNTLWGGVLGEAGAEGVALSDDGEGFAFKNFQRRLQVLQRLGVLLVVNSKNNLSDVEEVWQKNPHMLLKREDFAFVCANWQDKATNLRSIAETLNLGLDSFVFIDDNPAERELIRRELPMVATPDFPESPEQLAGLVDALALRYFNKLQLTAEDKHKTAQYQARAAAESLKTSAASMDDYYAALEMKGSIYPLTKENIARAEQLTQKTNQFNLTTKRYTAAQLEHFCTEGGRIYLMSLDDKFDRHGIVAMAMVRPEQGSEWVVDNFLMSCRVIGRTVERTLLAHIISDIRKAGATKLHGSFIPTAKNQQVADFYSRMGFSSVAENRWSFDVDQPFEALNWIKLFTP